MGNEGYGREGKGGKGGEGRDFRGGLLIFNSDPEWISDFYLNKWQSCFIEYIKKTILVPAKEELECISLL